MPYTFPDQTETERILYAIGVPVEVIREAAAFMAEGKKINGIKLIRDAANGGLSLKEAKEATEQLTGPVMLAQVGWFVSEDHGVTWTYRDTPIMVRPAMVGPA